MARYLVAFFLLISAWKFSSGYYSSRRCYGTGDCHLFTKNQDGGFDDEKHQWLVECNDGEGAIAVRDDDTHFEGLSGIWCGFLFPLKPASRGAYPYYPSCVVRNLTAGQSYCRSEDDGTNTTELFVAGIYKDPDTSQNFVPSLMKCCQTPESYQIDYTRCYYKKTFDRFGEHYTGEWLVKCDTHHVMTGLGKDLDLVNFTLSRVHGSKYFEKQVNPWDNKEHFTWIQCCPFYYAQKQAVLPSVSAAQVLDLNPTYSNYLTPELSGVGEKLTGSARVDFPSYSLPLRYQSTSILAPTLLSRSDSPNYTPAETYLMQKFGGSDKGYIDQNVLYDAPEKNYGQNVYRYSTVPDRYSGFSDPNSGVQVVSIQNYTRGPLDLQQQPVSGPSPVSVIQHAANVAAYNQFLATFNQLLGTYMKHPQTPVVQPENSEAEQIKYIQDPYSGQIQEAPLPTEAPLPSVQPAGQILRTGYVPMPLPSGLQNYILLASRDPELALSQLYNNAKITALNEGISPSSSFNSQPPPPSRSRGGIYNPGNTNNGGTLGQAQSANDIYDPKLLQGYYNWLASQKATSPAPQYYGSLAQVRTTQAPVIESTTTSTPVTTTPTVFISLGKGKNRNKLSFSIEGVNGTTGA